MKSCGTFHCHGLVSLMMLIAGGISADRGGCDGHGSKLDASKFQRDIHRIGCFMMANRLDWQYQLIFLNKNKTPK